MFLKKIKNPLFVILLALSFTASISNEAKAGYRHSNGQYYPSTGDKIMFKVVVWSTILIGGSIFSASN